MGYGNHIHALFINSFGVFPTLPRKDGAMEAKCWDNGGRRCGADRRRFSYAGHVPERRSGEERRSGTDRRKEPRLGPEHRSGNA